MIFVSGTLLDSCTHDQAQGASMPFSWLAHLAKRLKRGAHYAVPRHQSALSLLYQLAGQPRCQAS